MSQVFIPVCISMDTFLPPVSLRLTLFSVLSSTSNTRPLFSWNFIPSRLLSPQDKSSKGCDNQLAVPPLSTDGSKSQRSKLVFEDR